MKKILFETALRQRGYKSCKRYSDAVEEILKEEGLTWDHNLEQIEKIIPLYEKGGCKEALGAKGKGTYVNALRRYAECRKTVQDPMDLVERLSGYFYCFAGDPTLKMDFHLLGELEGEYERILAFGRDSFFQNCCTEDLERIPVLFSPEIKTKTYEPTELELAQRILDLCREKKCDVPAEQIAQILKKKEKIEVKILGEFCRKPQPHIVLYHRAIGGKTHEERVAGIAQTLAHEYMHYMEYRHCLACGAPYAVEEGLSEGIADFFALLYLLNSVQCYGDEKIRLAKRRYNAWKKRFGSAWPYANALYFYRLGNEKMDFSPDYYDYEPRCVDKLKRVFCATSDPAFAVKLMKE